MIGWCVCLGLFFWNQCYCALVGEDDRKISVFDKTAAAANIGYMQKSCIRRQLSPLLCGVVYHCFLFLLFVGGYILLSFAALFLVF